jgi:hypothetical protein
MEKLPSIEVWTVLIYRTSTSKSAGRGKQHNTPRVFANFADAREYALDQFKEVKASVYLEDVWPGYGEVTEVTLKSKEMEAATAFNEPYRLRFYAHILKQEVR